MCGLFGSVGFELDQERIDIVAHRGPGGRGRRTFMNPEGPVTLSRPRLASTDISDAGLQPKSDASGRCQLVFNGEIYNYRELRAEMIASGEVFATESNFEVPLCACMLWGDAALQRLCAMLVFLIWGDRDKRLFVARDLYGIKPLYLFDGRGGVAFGSDIKQLLSLPGQSARMNIVRVHDFLSAGLSDHARETMFPAIVQLRRGEYASIDASGAMAPKLVVRRWYAATAGELTLSEAEAAESFRNLLSGSVRLHLRSDVPVGSCLSGGLASSAIVCLMAQQLDSAAGGERVNTISARYLDKSVEEKPSMDAVVAHAHTLPHFIFQRPEDVFQRASDITWHQDEPFGSSSIFAQWCVFEEARRAGVKAMLDGQGADEQLAGDDASFPYCLAELTRQGHLFQVAGTILERHRFHGTSIAEQIKHVSQVATLQRRRYQALTQHDWIDGELISAQGNPNGGFQLGVEMLGLPWVKDIRSLCLGMTYATNLSMFLHWEARNSMAHSIEERVPFLEHPPVEFSLVLGSDHKIVGEDTKRVLRKGMAGILPDVIKERRDKLGFATPETAWFRGPLHGLISDGIEKTLSIYSWLFNGSGVRALCSDMLEGRRRVDFWLWRIVSIGLWGERHGVSI